MAIITYPLNGVTFDATDVETYLSTRSSGVFHENTHFPLSISGARAVTIGTGQAWIKNREFAGKSVCVDAPVNLSIAPANGTLPRIDRIVLRFDTSLNASVLAVKQGSASSSPVAPSVQRDSIVYELGLYTVYIPAASVSILENNITDTRGDPSVCGRMSDGVTTGGLTFDAAEGSIMAVDDNGALVPSNRTIASLGTGVSYRLDGTTLYINTL